MGKSSLNLGLSLVRVLSVLLSTIHVRGPHDSIIAFLSEYIIRTYDKEGKFKPDTDDEWITNNYCMLFGSLSDPESFRCTNLDCLTDTHFSEGSFLGEPRTLFKARAP